MKATYQPSSDLEQRQDELEEAWQPINVALNHGDPHKALDHYRAAKRQHKSALHWRTVDWLTDHLALAPTDRHPWGDDQGLLRLIYMIWPELPIRAFHMDMLPDLFGRFSEYHRQFPVAAAGRPLR